MKRVLAAKTGEKEGKLVRLNGWVHNRRDHGQLIFIDLRDRSGLVQLVFLPENKICHELANTLRSEWVIEVVGKVKERPRAMRNEQIASGRVEVEARELRVLNQAKTPPFEIAEMPELDKDAKKAKKADKESKKGEQEEEKSKGKVNEEVRLSYRYLDLRRAKMQRNLTVRHRVVNQIRNYLDRKGFREIETPILTKSTPEGARDFLVPSRLHPGSFYALPQAPQQLKQLLMVAGVERYFQLARCFRDEDLRGDRQPEFTQLDLEMSFVKPKQIMKIIEKMIIRIVRSLIQIDKKLGRRLTFNPFMVLDYDEAIKQYGSDTPDLREDKNDPNELAFVWIVNWPLFEYNEQEKRYDPCHHIFTAPRGKDIPLLDKNPLKARSLQYDLALNGHEICGGSIRIHRQDIQQKIFQLVGLSQREIKTKFNHLLKAFEYGAPPHGGIAMGLDRFLMILLNEESIREVIAFPKSGDGSDLTMGAPSEVTEEQLKELGLRIVE